MLVRQSHPAFFHRLTTVFYIGALRLDVAILYTYLLKLYYYLYMMLHTKLNNALQRDIVFLGETIATEKCT